MPHKGCPPTPNGRTGSTAVTIVSTDEDNLIWGMFPAVMAPNGLEKIGTSHILAENRTGKVGQNVNPESALREKRQFGGRFKINPCRTKPLILNQDAHQVPCVFLNYIRPLGQSYSTCFSRTGGSRGISTFFLNHKSLV
uniref:Uncharacterized protein n=1 Tax=Molossus molossus TaxID=27622 RepID=A0A7J8J0Z0_MOLMO|nr:hypothetical protein HJG59_010372 [Molossus molossus]